MKFLTNLILALMLIQSGTASAQGYNTYIANAKNAMSEGEYPQVHSYLRNAELACNPCTPVQKDEISNLRTAAFNEENKKLKDLLKEKEDILKEKEDILKEKNKARDALLSNETELQLTNIFLQPEARNNVPTLLYLANQYLNDNSSSVLRDQVYRKLTTGAIYQFEFRDSHSHQKNYISITHDGIGKTLAVGFGHEDESFIRFYDGDKGHETKVLNEPNRSVLTIGMSDDGKYLVSGGINSNKDGFLHLWDTESETFETIEAMDGNGLLVTEPVRQVKFFPSPQNKYLAVGTHYGQVFIVDTRTKKIIRRFDVLEKEKAIWDLDIIAYEDQWLILVSGEVGIVETYLIGEDFEYQKRIGSLTSSDTINHVHYASFYQGADSINIFGGGCENQIQLFSIDRKISGEWGEHSDEIRSVDTWGEEELFVSSDFSGKIYLNDLKRDRRLRFQHSASVDQVLILPDGKRIFSASQDGSAKVWDIELNELGLYYNSIKGYGEEHQFVVSPNANYILNGHQLIDHAHDWELEREFELHIDQETPAAISNDGKHIAVRNENNPQQIVIWDEKGKVRKGILDQHTSPISTLLFSQGGDSILSGSESGELICWLWKDNKSIPYKGHTGEVLDVAFTQRGEVLSAGADRLAYWWDKNGNPKATYKGHFRAVTQIRMAPNEAFVVTGSEDQTIRIWSAQGKIQNVLDKHQGPITALSIASHGQQILSGSRDSTAYLWDKQGYLMYQIDEFKSPIKTVFFTEGDESMIIVFDNERCQFVKAVPSLKIFFDSEKVYKPSNIVLEKLKYGFIEEVDPLKIKDHKQKEEIGLFFWQKASRTFVPLEKRKLLRAANNLFIRIPIESLSLEGGIAKMLVAENLNQNYPLDKLLQHFSASKQSFAKALLEEAQLTTNTNKKEKLLTKGLTIIKQYDSSLFDEKSIDIAGGLLLEKKEAEKIIDYIDLTSDEQRIYTAEFLWKKSDNIFEPKARERALNTAMDALSGVNNRAKVSQDYILWYAVVSHELKLEPSLKGLLVDADAETVSDLAKYVLDQADNLDLNPKTRIRIGESILQLYELSNQRLVAEDNEDEKILDSEDFSDLYFELGKEALLEREPSLAKNCLSKIEEYTPGASAKYMLAGHIQLASGDIEEAITNYDKIRKRAFIKELLDDIATFEEQGIIPNLDFQPRKLRERILFGEDFNGNFSQLNNEDLKLAADLLFKEVENAKTNSVRLNTQKQLISIHDIILQENQDFITQKKYKSNLGKLYYDLAQFQLYDSQFDSALVSINSALERNPNNDNIIARKAVVHALLGDWSNVKTYFNMIKEETEPQSNLSYKRWIMKEVEQITASNNENEPTDIDMVKVEAALEGS